MIRATLNTFSPTFVVNKQLIAIKYTTKPPVEVISPWVGEEEGVQVVYCKKETIPLQAFLRRLANGENGLRVRGKRVSNGLNTTISFSQLDRIEFSRELLKLLSDLKE